MSQFDAEEKKHLLIVGGKPEFNRRAKEFEETNPSGHRLFFAKDTSTALQLLDSERIDLIILEAFMENSANETPFQFLQIRKQQPKLEQITVRVVAAEPSYVGTLVLKNLKRTLKHFGAGLSTASISTTSSAISFSDY